MNMNMTRQDKIHPEVRALLHQNIMDATNLDIRQKAIARMGMKPPQDTPTDQMTKKRCCHLTYNGSEPVLRIRRHSNGKVICDVCNREIFTDFKNDRNIDILTDAIKVINQLLIFGMFNNLMAQPIAMLISLKEVLPDVAKLAGELNAHVLRVEASTATEANLGAEYFNNFTSMS
ncbi:MAG: hypothetical protein IKA36_03845 [Clostridia bacterium]|nr:hypothetical protein [Clostridia bacterium]